MFHRDEGEILKECKYYLECLEQKEKLYWMRTHPFTGLTIHGRWIDTCRKGCPDLIVLYKGKFIGFEIKRVGKPCYISPEQKKTREQIEEAGGFYYIVQDYTEIRDKLKEIMRTQSTKGVEL